MKNFASVDKYIASFPPEIQKALKQMRATVRKAAPRAEEKISYGMPGYSLNGPLVYFAAMKGHLGFYPTPSAIREFSDRLKGYSLSKGCVRLPWDQKLPLALVAAMTKFRVRENAADAKGAAGVHAAKKNVAKKKARKASKKTSRK